MEVSGEDEPVTPTGRVLLQPQFSQIINCAVGTRHPVDIDTLKTELSNSLMLQHPRFSSLLVLDKRGNEFWRKTQIILDDHIIIHPKHSISNPDNLLDEEGKISSILADFAVSSPLSTDKPLWEIHVLNELRCVILRVHHSLGDGISLLSMFLDTCQRTYDHKDDDHGVKNIDSRGRREYITIGFVGIMKMIWWTILSTIRFIGRFLWVKDMKTVLSGGDGVELWPRVAATAKFSLQDFKIVKNFISNATINDVLFGVISYGFSKYLNIESPHALQEGLQITGIAMVNLRKQPGLQ